MKKQIFGFMTAAVALLLVGCWQKSLHPFYAEKDLIANPLLPGTWHEPSEKPEEKPEENKPKWIFSHTGDKRYTLEIHDKDEKMEYDAHLFKLGESVFLDLYPRDRDLTVSAIPAHHLMKIVIEKNQLKLRLLSAKWVKEMVQARPNEIAHLITPDPDAPNDKEKGEVVLTAPTEALQKFLLEHMQKEGVFEDEGILKRSPEKLASR